MAEFFERRHGFPYQMCNNSNWSGPFDPSNLFFSASDWRRFKSNNSRNPCAQIFDNSQQIMARNYFFPDQNNIPADDQFDDDFKLEYMDLDEFLTENDLPIETVLQEQEEQLQQQVIDQQQQQQTQQLQQQQQPQQQEQPQQQQQQQQPPPLQQKQPLVDEHKSVKGPIHSSHQLHQQQLAMCGQQQATSPTPSTTMNNQSGSTQMVESNLLLATTMAQNSGVGYQNNHSGNQNPHLSGQMTNQSMGFNNKTIPPFPCTYRLGSSLSNIGMGELGLSTGSTMQDQVSSVGSGCRSVGKIEPEDPIDFDADKGDESLNGDDFGPGSILSKKRKKQMVSEESKDDKYWERRRKNNLAAKRSRDARRAKENQVAIRATFLERENKVLAQELRKARAENHLLKERLCKYEMVQLDC